MFGEIMQTGWENYSWYFAELLEVELECSGAVKDKGDVILIDPAEGELLGVLEAGV